MNSIMCTSIVGIIWLSVHKSLAQGQTATECQSWDWNPHISESCHQAIVTLKYRQVLALKPPQTILCHWFWGADKPADWTQAPRLTEGSRMRGGNTYLNQQLQSPVIQEAHLAVPAFCHLRGQDSKRGIRLGPAGTPSSLMYHFSTCDVLGLKMP